MAKHKPNPERKTIPRAPGECGKPKTLVTPEELEEALGYAREGARNNLICRMLGWDHQWLDARPDILARIDKKRAEHKMEILRKQNEKGQAGDTTMLIWLGKQHLEQSDKQAPAVSVVVGTRELSKEELVSLLKDRTVDCESAIAR